MERSPGKSSFPNGGQISAFATTADGDKTAMMTDVDRSTALRKETGCSLLQSSELKLADSWYREVQFLLSNMLCCGAMVHGKDHLKTFSLKVLS